MMGTYATVLANNPAVAQIEALNNRTVPGAAWAGFSWSARNTPSGNADLYIWSVGEGGSFSGGMSLYGRVRTVCGHLFGDGSVEITEVDSTPAIVMQGYVSPIGQGGYIATLRAFRSGRSLGPIKLLWLRKKFSPLVSIAAEPCPGSDIAYSGRFVGDGSDTHCPIGLLFDSQRSAGDIAGPPSFETGRLAMQDFQFNFVATIDPERRAECYAFDLLGQSSSPTIPAVQLGGTFVADASIGKQPGFQGSYQLFNSLFNPISGGAFSTSAPRSTRLRPGEACVLVRQSDSERAARTLRSPDR